MSGTTHRLRDRLAPGRLGSAALLLVALGSAGAISSACTTSARDPFVGDRSRDLGFSELEGGLPEGGRSNCISEHVKGEPVPLSIVVLLDRSGSMDGERWTSATNAIRAFADRSEVVGMKMGLQFFPALHGGDRCSAATYSDLAVPIEVLPGNVIPIQQRLMNTEPDGDTPMSAALNGAVSAVKTWLQGNDPHAGAVILVTDGDPSGCGNIDAVVSAASSGVAGTPSVKTFAVGMDGASFSNLDKVALAGGGSSKAFNVGGGVAAQHALLDALETIRTEALSCEYILPIPTPEDGVLDVDSVDVKFTPRANAQVETVHRVANKAACGERTGGFYYDDPKQPTRVILCPVSCSAVRGVSATEGKLDVVLGCIQKPG